MPDKPQFVTQEQFNAELKLLATKAYIDSKITDHLKQAHSSGGETFEGTLPSGGGGGSPAGGAESPAGMGGASTEYKRGPFGILGKYKAPSPPSGRAAGSTPITLEPLPAPNNVVYPALPLANQVGGYVLGTKKDMLVWVSEDASNVVVRNRVDVVGGNLTECVNRDLSQDIGGNLDRKVWGVQSTYVHGRTSTTHHEPTEEKQETWYKVEYAGWGHAAFTLGKSSLSVVLGEFKISHTTAVALTTNLGFSANISGSVTVNLKKDKAFNLCKALTAEQYEVGWRKWKKVINTIQDEEITKAGALLKNEVGSTVLTLEPEKVYAKSNDIFLDGQVAELNGTKRVWISSDKKCTIASDGVDINATTLQINAVTAKWGNGELKVKGQSKKGKKKKGKQSKDPDAPGFEIDLDSLLPDAPPAGP